MSFNDLFYVFKSTLFYKTFQQINKSDEFPHELPYFLKGNLLTLTKVLMDNVFPCFDKLAKQLEQNVIFVVYRQWLYLVNTE